MKPCDTCKKDFQQTKTTQTTCSWQCALQKVYADKDKKATLLSKKNERAARTDLRARKQAIKTKSQWLKDTQDNSFNPYIRKRDYGEVCISCGLSEAELQINSPIKMVCGHYLSIGAHSELRFHKFNANLQCTRCNGGAGKYGKFNHKEKTVTQNYRVNLIKKIGLDNVLFLEGPQQAQNLIIDDIIEIKQYFKDQAKLL